jgi:hypothetical protein
MQNKRKIQNVDCGFHSIGDEALETLEKFR